MVKSKEERITDILSANTALQNLFAEFGVDFDSASSDLIETLINYDALIQETTVYALAENPENITGKVEITEITTVGDIGGSLAGTYFILDSPGTPYYVWYNTGGSTDPALVNRSPIPVIFSPNDSAAQIASVTASAIDAELEFNASASGNVITISNAALGSVQDATNGTGFLGSGFSFNVIQQGLDPSQSITALNEAVSTAIGLFPAFIGSPHESFYRTFLSNEGTAYPYLLKWIYYTYKYFNEEQFFFNNLLEHYVPSYDASIISSTTQLKIYFDGLGIILDTLDQKIEDLYNFGDPDAIDERYLQHMAQLLGYQKEDFSIENISFRELIKNLTEIYKTKGTRYSFQLFFRLLGFQADLREYYWDRDAKNPENFASITEFDFLYYLTVQDPRTRTRTQTLNPNDSQSVQPIRTSQWTKVKDLRVFSSLQSDYTLDEILGLKDSQLPEEERFTYFKTNFINFQLTQFYNKQDLTAKDTDTILKYVRFLTPIYVSAFVEVITTPWQDFFEMSNPLAGEISLDGDPGDPFWVDILLPFLFVTLREYIPLNIEPAPPNAIVIANTATTHIAGDNFPDSAVDEILGEPKHGIEITGDVVLNSPVDLTENEFLNLKVDEGRGTLITIQGSNAQNFQDLITAINNNFLAASIDAVASRVGSAPNYDIRITSDTIGTDSKIYLIESLENDLFTALATTVDTPIPGSLTSKGYQELGLAYAAINTPTGLSASAEYDFYLNLDDEDYIEVDVTLENPAATTLEDIVNSINNHYSVSDSYTFSSSSTVEFQSQAILSDGKIVVAYRDVTTNSGKIVIINADGTLSRSGINFSLSDVRNISVTASNDANLPRFLVSWYDILNDVSKWTVYENDGTKITIDQILEPSTSGVLFIDAITLTNNNVAVFYTTTSPTNKGEVKIISLQSLSIVTHENWYNAAITNIKAHTLGDKMVGTGITGAGGQLVYLNEDGTFALTDEPTSTKNFSPGQSIANISLTETDSNYIVIGFRADKSSVPVDYKGYFTIWDDSGAVIKGVTPFTTEDIYKTAVAQTSINTLSFAYDLRSDGYTYYKGYDEDGDIVKKETLIYNDTSINEIAIELLPSGDIAFNGLANLKGFYERWNYIGQIASASTDSRLVLRSVLSGNTWDDTIESYAKTTDDGHFFEIENQSYVFDNYSTYYSTLGIDFTEERNKFNTFFQNSPADDFIDLVQDTLLLVFTLLIAANEFPNERVEKAGFYMQRNGYISRNPNRLPIENQPRGYYLRHLDVSEDLRNDPLRANKEIDWPQWMKEATPYAEWSSWELAIDYFTAQYDLPLYPATGGLNFGGAVDQFGPFEVFYYSQPSGSTVYYDIRGIVPQGQTATITFVIPGASPYIFPIGSEIAFVNENGIWETVPTTRSPSGKELSATVTHFSVWGVLNSTVPEADISINVAGSGLVGQIIQETEGDYLQISFTGISQYGPAQDYEYTATGSMTFDGLATTSLGNEFTYISIGSIEIVPTTTDSDFTFTYSWLPTGTILIAGQVDTTTEQLYFAAGSAILSGEAEIVNIFDFLYEAIGGLTLTGISSTTSEQFYTPTDGLTFAGQVENNIVEAVVEVSIVIPPILSGDADIVFTEIKTFSASGNIDLLGAPAWQAINLSGTIAGTDPIGLNDSTTYKFRINGTLYSITTGISDNYFNLISLVNNEITPDELSAFISSANDKIYIINVAEKGFEARIDITDETSILPSEHLFTNIVDFDSYSGASQGLDVELEFVSEASGSMSFSGSSGYQEVGL